MLKTVLPMNAAGMHRSPLLQEQSYITRFRLQSMARVPVIALQRKYCLVPTNPFVRNGSYGSQNQPFGASHRYHAKTVASATLQ